MSSLPSRAESADPEESEVAVSVAETPRRSEEPAAPAAHPELYKCSCGVEQDVRLMLVCQSCLTKPHDEATQMEVLKVVMCEGCAESRHRRHLLLDAPTVLLPRAHGAKEDALRAAREYFEKDAEEAEKLMEEYRATLRETREELREIEEHHDQMPSMLLKMRLQDDRDKVQTKMARMSKSVKEALEAARES